MSHESFPLGFPKRLEVPSKEALSKSQVTSLQEWPCLECLQSMSPSGPHRILGLVGSCEGLWDLGPCLPHLWRLTYIWQSPEGEIEGLCTETWEQSVSNVKSCCLSVGLWPRLRGTVNTLGLPGPGVQAHL
jgi:hypothetical protein